MTHGTTNCNLLAFKHQERSACTDPTDADGLLICENQRLSLDFFRSFVCTSTISSSTPVSAIFLVPRLATSRYCASSRLRNKMVVAVRARHRDCCRTGVVDSNQLEQYTFAIFNSDGGRSFQNFNADSIAQNVYRSTSTRQPHIHDVMRRIVILCCSGQQVVRRFPLNPAIPPETNSTTAPSTHVAAIVLFFIFDLRETKKPTMRTAVANTINKIAPVLVETLPT